jgi:hypothetical protein
MFSAEVWGGSPRRVEGLGVQACGGDGSPLEALPEAERNDREAFWAEVRALIERAGEKAL